MTLRLPSISTLTCALALTGCVGGDGGTATQASAGTETGDTSAATDSASSTSGSTTAAETDSTASGTSTEGTAGTSTSTTSTTSTTDATTDATTETTDTTTGSGLCPPPEEVSADFSISPDPPMLDAVSCVVTALDSQANAAILSLECDGTEYELTVSSEPFHAPTIAVNDVVIVDYVRDDVFWINRWLAVRTEDSAWTLIGAVSSSAFDPPGTTLAEFFGTPVLTEQDGLCEPTAELCGDEERRAIRMEVEGTGQPVHDHGIGYANVLAFGIHMVVETARRSLTFGCDDYPEAWYQLVFVWFPSE